MPRPAVRDTPKWVCDCGGESGYVQIRNHEPGSPFEVAGHYHRRECLVCGARWSFTLPLGMRAPACGRRKARRRGTRKPYLKGKDGTLEEQRSAWSAWSALTDEARAEFLYQIRGARPSRP